MINKENHDAEWIQGLFSMHIISEVMYQRQIMNIDLDLDVYRTLYRVLCNGLYGKKMGTADEHR